MEIFHNMTLRLQCHGVIHTSSLITLLLFFVIFVNALVHESTTDLCGGFHVLRKRKEIQFICKRLNSKFAVK